MTPADASRIQAAEAKQGGGGVEKGGFAARAQVGRGVVCGAGAGNGLQQPGPEQTRQLPRARGSGRGRCRRNHALQHTLAIKAFTSV